MRNLSNSLPYPPAQAPGRTHEALQRLDFESKPVLTRIALQADALTELAAMADRNRPPGLSRKRPLRRDHFDAAAQRRGLDPRALETKMDRHGNLTVHGQALMQRHLKTDFRPVSKELLERLQAEARDPVAPRPLGVRRLIAVGLEENVPINYLFNSIRKNGDLTEVGEGIVRRAGEDAGKKASP